MWDPTVGKLQVFWQRFIMEEGLCYMFNNEVLVVARSRYTHEVD